jgi:branched-chain amino acid transport system ATP-binding protein
VASTGQPRREVSEGGKLEALRVEDLGVRFGGLWALKGLSFTLNEGEILGVMGPNGAGKTTLINIISGLIKPTTGTVYLHGNELTGHSPHQICRLGLARTFQIVRPFANLSVFENVLVPALECRKSGGRTEDTASTVERCIEVAGLSQKKHEVASGLNEREKRRLELARVLATGPKVLLLDEIAAGSAPDEAQDIVNTVKELNDKQGVSICMVEHVMRVLMNVSDRVLVLDQGEKLAEGTPTDVANDERVIKVYLGS